MVSTVCLTHKGAPKIADMFLRSLELDNKDDSFAVPFEYKVLQCPYYFKKTQELEESLIWNGKAIIVCHSFEFFLHIRMVFWW